MKKTAISRRRSKRRSPHKDSRRLAFFGYENLEPRKMLSANNSGDEQAIRLHLAASDETAYLQQGDNDVVFVDSQDASGATQYTLQQTFLERPIRGAVLLVELSDTGEFTVITNRGDADFVPANLEGPNISFARADEVGNLENADLPDDYTTEGHLIWFRVGGIGNLSWQVDTTVNSAHGTSQFTSIVDAQNADLLSQAQVSDATDVHGDNIPWIVINDNVGPSGSQNYALPFESVVAISVGCTGSLIAPNVVLSARHCNIAAGHEIYFGPDSNAPTSTFTVESTILPAGPSTGDFLDGGDVSIHILTEDVPASVGTPYRLIDADAELVGNDMVLVGYGTNGIGSQGTLGTSDGLRWGGENVLDAYGPAAPGGGFGANLLTSDFDDGTDANNGTGDAEPLFFEASGAPGDSGGPNLIRYGDEFLVTAIVSGGNSGVSPYGTVMWWTATAIYRADIEAVGGEFVDCCVADVAFDSAEYEPGDIATITVADVNPTSFPVEITLTSSSGDSEVFELTEEQGANYSISVPLVSGTPLPGDGLLQASGQITATYNDGDDGDGNSTFVTANAVIIGGDIGEAGVITNLNHNTQTINLELSYENPVVVVGPATRIGGHPVTVRVGNVTSNSFDVVLDEWDYLDGRHTRESVGYMVFEAGEHELTDGTIIKAGLGTSSSRWHSFDLSESGFTEAPLIFTQIMSQNDEASAITRIRNASENGFQVRIQDQQLYSPQSHAAETVGYIAIQQRSGNASGIVYETGTIDDVTHQTSSMSFTQSFPTAPVFLAAMQSYNGGDPASVRLRTAAMTNTGASVFVEEERSADLEIGHIGETIGYFALASGNITGGNSGPRPPQFITHFEEHTPPTPNLVDESAIDEIRNNFANQDEIFEDVSREAATALLSELELALATPNGLSGIGLSGAVDANQAGEVEQRGSATDIAEATTVDELAFGSWFV